MSRSLRNLTLVSLCAVVLARAQAPVSGKIVQIDLADIVHPVSAAYVKDGLSHAKDIGARAVVLRLDTPGGLVDSMREIVEAILSSPVPVITWVGPNGARAASAGFFMLLAGDGAVMAPGTNSGAAHPVTATGQKIEDVMEKKVVSDASAYIRSYTAKRGRGIANNFLFHHILDLLTGCGDRMRSAAIRSRRHDGDIAGQKNEESCGCCARAIGSDPRNNRYRRGKNCFDDFTHRVDESPRRVQAQK